jgi:hypothetical protein
MATDAAAVYTNKSGTFPDVLGINASGPSATDGTEFIAAMINNYMFGVQQALLDHAGLIPDGVTEAAGTAQTIEAIQKGFAAGPGMGVVWWANDDPATTGHRVLLLNGQVITIATYQDLVDITYVGDGNNPTASAFYKTSDAGGTTRDTAGTYFVLPDLRGYTLRGLDTAASVDPDGASRDVGSIQAFDTVDLFATASMVASGNIEWRRINTLSWNRNFTTTGATTSSTSGAVTTGLEVLPLLTGETRMVNIATRFGITY